MKVVFSRPASGYIADDGTGVDPAQPVVALFRLRDGVWEGGPQESFDKYKSLPYMYRIVNAQGRTVHRSDIFSRGQIGRGAINPVQATWPGTVATLDGIVSCSMVIDPDVVRRGFRIPSGDDLQITGLPMAAISRTALPDSRRAFGKKLCASSSSAAPPFSLKKCMSMDRACT